MSIPEDLVFLNQHFEAFSGAEPTEQAQELLEAWNRVCISHIDLERVLEKVEPALSGLGAIFDAFDVVRKPEDYKGES